MLTHKRYAIPIYGGVIHVVKATDFNAALDKFRLRSRVWDSDDLAQDDDWGEANGIAMSERPLGTGKLWVLLKPKCPAAVMAHEAVHLAHYVWLGMGETSVDALKDEAFCYLVQWFVERMTA